MPPRRRPKDQQPTPPTTVPKKSGDPFGRYGTTSGDWGPSPETIIASGTSGAKIKELMEYGFDPQAAKAIAEGKRLTKIPGVTQLLKGSQGLITGKKGIAENVGNIAAGTGKIFLTNLAAVGVGRYTPIAAPLRVLGRTSVGRFAKAPIQALGRSTFAKDVRSVLGLVKALGADKPEPVPALLPGPSRPPTIPPRLAIPQRTGQPGLGQSPYPMGRGSPEINPFQGSRGRPLGQGEEFVPTPSPTATPPRTSRGVPARTRTRSTTRSKPGTSAPKPETSAAPKPTKQVTSAKPSTSPSFQKQELLKQLQRFSRTPKKS